MSETIGNPLSWSVDAAKGAGHYVGSVTGRLGSGDPERAALPAVRKIGMEDLRAALREGYADFVACRSDVVFLCLIYPVIGLVLAWAFFSGNLLPLVFPILSGFALVGPVAAVGLYEMSRRREAGQTPRWSDGFAVLKSPSFGAIFVLGAVLFLIFLVWIITAHGIWAATLGPEPSRAPDAPPCALAARASRAAVNAGADPSTHAASARPLEALAAFCASR